MRCNRGGLLNCPVLGQCDYASEYRHSFLWTLWEKATMSLEPNSTAIGFYRSVVGKHEGSGPVGALEQVCRKVIEDSDLS